MSVLPCLHVSTAGDCEGIARSAEVDCASRKASSVIAVAAGGRQGWLAGFPASAEAGRGGAIDRAPSHVARISPIACAVFAAAATRTPGAYGPY